MRKWGGKSLLRRNLEEACKDRKREKNVLLSYFWLKKKEKEKKSKINGKKKITMIQENRVERAHWCQGVT